MKFRWNVKRKTYCLILLSYLLILFVPMAGSVFLHFYNVRLVREQSEDMAQRMLEGIRDRVDTYMNSIWQMNLIAAQLDTVNDMLAAQTGAESEEAYGLYRVGRELEMFYSFDQSLEDLFVYFTDNRKMAGRNGSLSLELYGQMYLESAEKGKFLEDYFSVPHYRECVRLSGENGRNRLLCVLSDLSALGNDVPRYTVGAVVSEDYLKKLLQSVGWMEGTISMVQDRDGTVLWGTEDYAFLQQVSGNFPVSDTKNRYQTMEAGGQKYAAMAKVSEMTGWTYTILIPVSVIEQGADQMQRYYFLMLFGCTAVGGIAAGAVSRKQFRPVKTMQELLNQFSHASGGKMPKGKESYHWLQEQVDRFFEERINTMTILRQDRRELKNYYLLRLLENSYTEDMDENLKNCQIVFEYPYYAVIQLFPAESAARAEEESLMLFVIKNIFSELLESGGDMRVYMVHVGKRVAGIINLQNPGSMDQLYDHIYRAQELIEENFQQKIAALVSDCYGSRMEIFKAYQDSCELEEYLPFSEDLVLCSKDIQDLGKTYHYNAELDQKLLNAVKAGNEELAEEQLVLILNPYDMGKISLNVYRCLVFDIWRTISRAAEESGSSDAAAQYSLEEELFADVSPGRIKETFTEQIRQICRRIQQAQKEGGRDKELSRKVQAYILEHFRDPDLNVSQIGLQFHLTPSYLSSLYKKQTGGSLLEYLNQARLAEAERLLKQGFSVTETAKQAGFRDSTYLIRVYKKKNGITPGQKKTILQ